ncbi:MAG: hypothetical protein RBS32_11210 [Aliarcobacter sp.]|jgi:hypothetical protein|nr:hypothetical protein [Aliarcobacter sp.]
MNKNVKTETIQIETTVDDVLLKGELKFWAKDYCIKLIEPFEGSSSYRLQYAVPVKYVYEKSENPSCHEIELCEKSKEILKSIYFKNINLQGK